MVDLDTLVSTRKSLHALAEQILAKARHDSDGRIGLVPGPRGIATPGFGPEARVLAVEGAHLVDTTAGVRREAAITTLREAGEFVGLEPGIPGALWTMVAPVGLDDQLVVDAGAADELGAWLSLVAEVLERVAGVLASEDDRELGSATLWPEHLDLAATVAEINVGGSCGDGFCAEPYLYVGPWTVPANDGPPGDDPVWNAPFGAVLPRSRVVDADAATEFVLDRCRRAWAAGTGQVAG